MSGRVDTVTEDGIILWLHMQVADAGFSRDWKAVLFGACRSTHSTDTG